MKKAAALLVLLACVSGIQGADKPQFPTPAQSIYGPVIYIALAGVHYGPLAYTTSADVNKYTVGVILDGAISVMVSLGRQENCVAAKDPDRCELDRRRLVWIQDNLLIAEDDGRLVGPHWQPLKHLFPWYAYCATAVAARSVINDPDDLLHAGVSRGEARCTDAIIMVVDWPKELQSPGAIERGSDYPGRERN